MFDPKKATHSKIYAQNFLKDAALVKNLISASSINAGDVVLEIGAGEGVITRELAKTAGKVIAVEKDPRLASLLHGRFKDVSRVNIVQGDFLTMPLPKGTCKIFANPPFNITSQVIKKFAYTQDRPRDAWLFMQKEAAERFCGLKQEYEFSIIAKAWFTFTIVREFNRNDFVPAPNVDVVLLHMHLIEKAPLKADEEDLWKKFVHYGFSRQKKDLEANFKQIFTHEQWKRMSRDLHFPIGIQSIQAEIGIWLGLFRSFRERVEPVKQDLVKKFPLPQ